LLFDTPWSKTIEKTLGFSTVTMTFSERQSTMVFFFDLLKNNCFIRVSENVIYVTASKNVTARGVISAKFSMFFGRVVERQLINVVHRKKQTDRKIYIILPKF
jgi:hypothetical protein